MKKWLVILIMALLLTGCGKQQEGKVQEGSSEQIQTESVEEESKEQSRESKQTEETKEPVEESSQAEESADVTVSESPEESIESEEGTEEQESTEDEVKVYFPKSSEEEIPDEILAGMSADELRNSRYEIYERHGYKPDKSVLSPVEIRNMEKMEAIEAGVRLATPVPTTDLISFCCATIRDYIHVFYVYISDGDLYYYCGDTGMFSTDFYYGQIKKYAGLSNIRRVKTLNCGTSVDPTPCLITEEGEVYWFYEADSWSDEEFSLVKFEFLEGYQVEDILSYSGEWQHQVEVLLKDGRIVYLESERWD